MASYPTLPTHIQCITSTDRLSPQYLIYSTKVNFLSHTTKLFHRKKTLLTTPPAYYTPHNLYHLTGKKEQRLPMSGRQRQPFAYIL